MAEKLKVSSSFDIKKEASKDGGSGHIAAHTFTFFELATATKHFRADCLLGEGGFGRVYKGRLESTNQVFFFFFLASLSKKKYYCILFPSEFELTAHSEFIQLHFYV